MHVPIYATTLFLTLAALPATAGPHRPETTKVHFLAPADGASLGGPVHVAVGPRRAAMSEPMLAEDHFRHFGGGQTQSDLTLPAGTHSPQFIAGDQNHIAHDPALVPDKITLR